MTEKKVNAQWIGRFEIATATSFKVVAGSVWLTQSNDPQDYFLSTGAEMLVRPGRLVLQALQSAHIQLEKKP